MAPNGAVKTCDLHSLLPRLTLPCYKMSVAVGLSLRRLTVYPYKQIRCVKYLQIFAPASQQESRAVARKTACYF